MGMLQSEAAEAVALDSGREQQPMAVARWQGQTAAPAGCLLIPALDEKQI